MVLLARGGACGSTGAAGSTGGRGVAGNAGASGCVRAVGVDEPSRGSEVVGVVVPTRGAVAGAGAGVAGAAGAAASVEMPVGSVATGCVAARGGVGAAGADASGELARGAGGTFAVGIVFVVPGPGAAGALASGGAAGGGDPSGGGIAGTPVTGVRLGGGLGGAARAIGWLFIEAGANGCGTPDDGATGGTVAERGPGEGRCDIARGDADASDGFGVGALPSTVAPFGGAAGTPAPVPIAPGGPPGVALWTGAGGTVTTGMPIIVRACWPDVAGRGAAGAEGAAGAPGVPPCVLARPLAIEPRRAWSGDGLSFASVPSGFLRSSATLPPDSALSPIDRGTDKPALVRPDVCVGPHSDGRVTCTSRPPKPLRWPHGLSYAWLAK
jgi:hypothetical protein